MAPSSLGCPMSKSRSAVPTVLLRTSTISGRWDKLTMFLDIGDTESQSGTVRLLILSCNINLSGILLMFAWWVLGSTAILISRYFKPLFPRNKLLGTAVWFQVDCHVHRGNSDVFVFQLHRDMMILSVIIQVVCVLFIFYQAGWTWYQCSYMCTSDVESTWVGKSTTSELQDFSKKMHGITGFTATVLALLQPVFGLLRPSPTSSIRPIFNWGHWFIGMFSWAVACKLFILVPNILDLSSRNHRSCHPNGKDRTE